MKSRVWIALLLALLLPLRGALAAAVLCPPESGGAAAHRHADIDADANAGAHAHAGHDATHGSGGTGQDRCAQCAASCALTPLPSAAPALPGAPPRAGAVFPPPPAPALGLFPARWERPPRGA